MPTAASQHANSNNACRLWVLALTFIALIAAWVPGQTTMQCDLQVLSVEASGVTGNWQSLLVDGAVAARVVNAGQATVPVPFDVTFFEDTNGNDAFDPGTDLVLATRLFTSPLPSRGQVAHIAANLGGAVQFRGSRIHVVLDRTNAVPEIDDTNNVGSTDALRALPAASPIATTVEWSWTSSTTYPTSDKVISNPVVVDMNGDGMPDILFSTIVTIANASDDAILRCVSGDGSGEIFSVDVPGQYLMGWAQLAVGDIDLDGFPEVVAHLRDASNPYTGGLIAFEHDGTLKWTHGGLELISRGGPSIANLDGTGTPEIIVGRQVLDSAGNLLWTGTGNAGMNGGSVSSIVADVNLDGTLEVVAGSTIYSATGSILHDAGLGEGFNAVGNFDADAFPEIVLVSAGKIWLLEHDGTVKWGPVFTYGIGGVPLVADLDGDGEPEIGIAGDNGYTVLETDGSVKWMKDGWASNPLLRSSTAFDLDGDGSMEVLYQRNNHTYIWRGVDGSEAGPDILLSSANYAQYPVVADVDNDGSAEIVLTAAYSSSAWGIAVIGDAGSGWASTRKVWNQYTYHVTNVNEDGTIPAAEQNSWQWPLASPYNGYRQNQLGAPLVHQMVPDLTTSKLEFGQFGADATIRVGNGGAVDVASGLPVSFYDGDPSLAGVLLGTVTTSQTLQPGSFEDLTLTFASPFPGTATIYVVADDSGGLIGGVTEFDETNNVYSLTFGNCGTASWHLYGIGVAGSGGVPTLNLSASPHFGTTVNITMGNTSGAQNVGWLVAGFEPMAYQTPFPGTLLVRPTGWHAMLMMPGNSQISVTIPMLIPDCMRDIYIQLVHADQGGWSGGYAFSRGLHMVLGL